MPANQAPSGPLSVECASGYCLNGQFVNWNCDSLGNWTGTSCAQDLSSMTIVNKDPAHNTVMPVPMPVVFTFSEATQVGTGSGERVKKFTKLMVAIEKVSYEATTNPGDPSNRAVITQNSSLMTSTLQIVFYDWSP